MVADGQRLFAEALARALDHYDDLEAVEARATSGEEILNAVQLLRPDVALIDYWMPGLSAPEVTRAVVGLGNGPKVLLLSWVHGPGEVQEALASGASGFLPKGITLDQLVEGIRQAHAGSSLVYGEELANLVEDLSRRTGEAEQLTRLVSKLSKREVEILERLAQGWDPTLVAQDLHIAAGTLKNHLHNILVKTGARTRLEAIALAQRAGVITGRPPNKPPRSH